MKTLYTARATSTGGREGHAETDDKRLVVDFARPGSDKPGTNPEQLFACGYAACFGGAMAYLAGQQKLAMGELAIENEVNLNQDEGGFFISVQMHVKLPQMEQKAAEKLVADAHQFCPYSKATRGNISVRFTVNGQKIA
ncbi:MAG: organic hydroperoxide resistance protein [Alphaproteobacteria bacterium]|nr:organic hydroperoxide resistance protein [Alphaproteobacteria bacterium]